MSHDAHHRARHAFAPGRLLTALIRLLFTVVVALGAFTTASTLPVSAEVLEESEDGEPIEKEEALRASATRAPSSGGPPRAADCDRPRVPPALTPSSAAPAPPSWLRPRRIPPDDDDDDDARA